MKQNTVNCSQILCTNKFNTDSIVVYIIYYEIIYKNFFYIQADFNFRKKKFVYQNCDQNTKS